MFMVFIIAMVFSFVIKNPKSIKQIVDLIFFIYVKYKSTWVYNVSHPAFHICFLIFRENYFL